MPVLLLERVPLPSLKTYTSVSVLLLACAVYFAHQVLIGSIEVEVTEKNDTVLRNIFNSTHNVSLEEDGYILGTVHVMINSTWCLWVMVNMAYCCLILFGKLIQCMAFGELRVSEQQHIKDKFWNFVFYKFIFIFGVMNVQDMGEVILWCGWFSVLGFLHLLAQLCKDRFEYLSFSPTTPTSTHVKVLGLLGLILSVSGLLLAGCVVICYLYASLNTFAFMAAECILLINRTFYVIVRYGIHLWDLNHDGVWENRALCIYYSELIFELAGLSVDFVHHLHMLVWGNILLSMASLVICMQVRYLFHEFQRRIKRHKNYLRVVNSMEAKFPMATKEELQANNDDCAICWEKMETGRKLPCGHFYHNACLRSWLEQDTSCPTCRTNLGDPTVPPPTQRPVPPQAATNNAHNVRPHTNRTFNHFFHFDGPRYVSWLPSFSVEVTHTELGGVVQATARRALLQTSQLDNMVRQVQDVFPNMPANVLLEDLRSTRSVEITIENIIEGRLQAPPSNILRSPSPTSSVDSSASSTGESNSDSPVPTEASGEDPWARNNAINFFVEENLLEPEPEDPVEEETEQELPSTSGSRFSKSSKEREKMLKSRKESLLEAARKKYVSTQSLEHRLDTGDHADIRSQQRELAFQAAQRRMNREH